MNRMVNEKYLGKIQLKFNEFGNIKNALIKAGLNKNLIKSFEDTFVGK